MAIQDEPYKNDLIALYTAMANSPMSLQDYAAKFAEITSAQILTGEVMPGILVAGNATASTGKLI